MKMSPTLGQWALIALFGALGLPWLAVGFYGVIIFTRNGDDNDGE